MLLLCARRGIEVFAAVGGEPSHRIQEVPEFGGNFIERRKYNDKEDHRF